MRAGGLLHWPRKINHYKAIAMRQSGHSPAPVRRGPAVMSGKVKPGAARIDFLHQLHSDPVTEDDLAALMAARSTPPVINGLAARFASETHDLADGPAAWHIDGQVRIFWPRPEGGGAFICQARRRPRGGKPGAWCDWGVADEPGPAVTIRQRASDYEGASYDLRARPVKGVDWAQAVVDWPLGLDTLAQPGQERTAAWCLARTATMILIWIRADRQTPAVAIESAYSLRWRRGRRSQGRPRVAWPWGVRLQANRRA